MPRAVIIGTTGQDGTLLFQLLDRKGYQILGIGRTKILTNCADWNDHPAVDINDFQQVSALIQKIQPDEIYHLAAVHQSSEDPVPDPVSLFKQSYQVNVISLVHVLESIRQCSPRSRLFYAASSHIFGRPATEPQDESTPLNPLNSYAISKVSGLYLCRLYRSIHQVFAAVGILYNHESPLRGEQFVSSKIAQGVIRCRNDPVFRLELGDLSAEVDWGYAPDYVEAMHRIVNLPDPDDFVIATGEKHRVEDFVRIAFESQGMNWRDHVIERKDIITRPPVARVGNSAKLVKAAGWKRSVTFPEMVRLLVASAEVPHE